MDSYGLRVATRLAACSFFFCMKYFFLTSCNSRASRSISYLYSFTCDSYMFSSDAIACTQEILPGKQIPYFTANNIPCSHFHLLRLFTQRLLVNLELLGHFRSGLSRQDVFEFDVQLLLLLNEQLLLDDLLRLRNQSFLRTKHQVERRVSYRINRCLNRCFHLQCLYFLNHFIGARIAALQFAPAVNVHGVLELLLQSLASRAFTQQLALEVIHFASAHRKTLRAANWHCNQSNLRGIDRFSFEVYLHVKIKICNQEKIYATVLLTKGERLLGLNRK